MIHYEGVQLHNVHIMNSPLLHPYYMLLLFIYTVIKKVPQHVVVRLSLFRGVFLFCEMFK